MNRTANTAAVVWIDGERKAPDGAHVSARDRGLTLADGLFETMRADHGTVFKLDCHLSRLRQALAVMHIPVPPRLREWVSAAVHDAHTSSAAGTPLAVRLTVTRGEGAGVLPPAEAAPTTIVTITPLPVFPAAVYDRGLSAHLASGRRNERSMTMGLKTLAYTDAIAAAIEAQRAGMDEALFLDTEGHCSEATSSNLFAWTGASLVTPPLRCAALPGITRATVLEIAAALDIPAEERAFGPDELFACDEAFLTSSLRGIAPLVRIDARVIGTGAPGALTRRIAAAYAEAIAADCASPASAPRVHDPAGARA